MIESSNIIVINLKDLIYSLKETLPLDTEFNIHNSGEYCEYQIRLLDEDFENSAEFGRFLMVAGASGKKFEDWKSVREYEKSLK